MTAASVGELRSKESYSGLDVFVYSLRNFIIRTLIDYYCLSLTSFSHYQLPLVVFLLSTVSRFRI
jgi:hypothetical protein